MEFTDSGIRVTYYYSAGVGIASPQVRALCDPWFTQGIYDGSWFQYPRLDDPLEVIGAADLVYVSHIHPDHYDPVFLRAYLARFPEARVVIAPFVPNYLQKRMRADGIPHEVATRLRFGETEVGLFLSGPGPPSAIDSALAMRRRDDAVVNFNDNPGGADQIRAIREFCGEIDVALLPCAGAGAWPQTYFDPGPELERATRAKSERSLAKYLRIAEALDARVRVPFAGKYVLGGRLHGLNRYRGVPDAVEVLDLDPRAVVLADGGRASIDTRTLEPTAVRTEAYSVEELERFAASLAEVPMAWEGEAVPDERGLASLFADAYGRAHARSQVEGDWYFCFRDPAGWTVLNANREVRMCERRTEVAELLPRSELTVDPRYLGGLLAGRYHWNNAEIGSQYTTRRYPEEYRPEVQAFLNFLHA